MQKMQIINNFSRNREYETKKAPKQFKEIYSSGKRQNTPGVFGLERAGGKN